MAEGEEFPIPDEVAELFLDYMAFVELRDRYVSLRYFGMNAAIKCAKSATRKREAFWRAVREIYPEEKGDLTYDHSRRIVTRRVASS